MTVPQYLLTKDLKIVKTKFPNTETRQKPRSDICGRCERKLNSEEIRVSRNEMRGERETHREGTVTYYYLCNECYNALNPN